MIATLRLNGLCCANCASRIERQVRRIPDVTDADLSFMTQKLTIQTDGGDIDAIIEETSRIAKRIEGNIRIERIR